MVTAYGFGRLKPRARLKLRHETSETHGVERISESVMGAPAPVAPANGGFPEPLSGQPVRLVRALHSDCGSTTLVRVPRDVPSRAVRVVACGSCGQSFECPPVSEVGVLAPGAKPRPRSHSKPVRSGARKPQLLRLARPAIRRPAVKRPEGLRLPSMPRVAAPTLPAYAAVPLALAAVVGGLFLIQAQNASNHDSTTTPPADSSAQAPAAAPAAPGSTTAPTGSANASGQAKLIRGSNFTIALPPGWKQTTPANGATFAAESADGGADANLWIRNEPKLDYPTFEAASLAQLRTLAGSAHVVGRVTAPTAEGTIVRLAADVPAGKPAYDVTLRVYGPYRYYLATTLQPNASSEASNGVAMVANTLTPVADGAGQ